MSREATAGRNRPAIALVALGAVVAVSGVLSDPQSGFAGLLVAAVFGLTIALGAAILFAVNGVIDARWYRPIAGLPLAVAGTMTAPVVALAAVLALGLEALYPWAQADQVAHSHLLQEKAVWLNPPFFVARAALVLIAWVVLVAVLRSRLAAVHRGGAWASLRSVSALFLVALAPTLSIASWDWTMSLEPEWFSTMWAVYGFAGAFTAGIAAVALLAVYLDRAGLLSRPLSGAVYHDLGKLLFAFTCFWAYIWFCQYMLIWYANIPEEATWFAHRTTGGWAVLFWLNPIVNWVLPFIALMSVRAKRDPALLAQVSLLVLAGHWLDTYLMVGPALGVSGLPIYAFAATVAVTAAMWLRARATALAPAPSR